jgi:UDP-N-acetylmuramate--alanine ligase
VVIGGKLKSIGRNAVLGQGDFIVAEADESDGSFSSISPAIAVVTNIDREHLDFYKDLDAIKAVFLDFIDRIPFTAWPCSAWTTSHSRASSPESRNG